MQLQDKISALIELSNFLNDYLNHGGEKYPALSEKLDTEILKSEQNNSWFTPEFQKFALRYWAHHLREEPLQKWVEAYTFSKSSKIGLVLAGNIPMVGFHDVLSVLISGNQAQVKLSQKDPYLIPFMIDFWKELNPFLEIEWVEKLEDFDAVIATGSNNTARYFETYFKNKPHIIRKNRTSVAALSGDETEAELIGLAQDVFTYFGLGCRNVTQIIAPKNFDKDRLFQAFFNYAELAKHHKYYNSYEYYRALYMLNKDVFWDNNFALLKESDALFAPVATINYIEYETLAEIDSWIQNNPDNIQAIVSNMSHFTEATALGSAQNPALDSYADGVDVMDFLQKI